MFSEGSDKQKREKMVEKQLVTRGIKDNRMLEAFRTVPRHLFVPRQYRQDSYKDCPLPIGEKQTISQPFIVAHMTELLNIRKGDKVLEIGTGSGYQASILNYLGAKVYGVERIKKLKEQAERNFKQAGCENVKIKYGDGTKGWPGYAPYRGILVTAASPSLPGPLLEQLEESGRLVIPEGGKFIQELKVYTKLENGEVKADNYGGCRFVPLLGEHGWDEKK